MDTTPCWPSKNPLSGAFYFGVINASLTSIGAAIRHQDVLHEAMVILVGGSITGFCASTLILMLSFFFEHILLNIGIFLISFLICPEIGRIILQAQENWASTLLDNLIGLFIGLGIGFSLWFGRKAYGYHHASVAPQYMIHPNHAVVPEEPKFQDLEIRQACFTG